MANRRMTSNEICASNSFLSMSKAAQAFYHLLILKADDEGVVEAELVKRLGQFTAKNLAELIGHGYLIPLEEEPGVFWIRHWDEQNKVQSDRFHPSIYHDQLRTIRALDRSNRHDPDPVRTAECSGGGPSGTDPVNRLSTEDRKGKDRKGKYKPSGYRNQFNSIEQHDYDFEAIEQQLLSN